MNAISLQQLNWADFVIVGIIIISGLISLMRGFVREAISLATWIVAAWVAIRFANLLAAVGFLTNHIHSPSLRMGVAFGILFLAVLILGGLLNYLFSQLVEKTGLSGTDRLVGLIFGLIRGALLIGVLVLVGNLMNLTKDPWWQTSQLIPHFQAIASWLQSFVPGEINHFSLLFNK